MVRLRNTVLWSLRKHQAGARRGRLSIRGREDGQALVEFALIVMPFTMLLFGVIQFGMLLNNYITLANAVAYSARTLAVSRGAGTGPPTACTLALTALNNAAVGLNSSQITTNLSTNSPAVFPAPDNSTCSQMVEGEPAVVQATYPCTLQVLAVNFWKNCTLTSKITVAIE